MLEEDNTVSEPEALYENTPHEKRITFFNSFEEAELHELKEMAAHSYKERLDNLSTIRKRTYGHLLLPNGDWPPLKRIITIDKGFINEI